MSKVDLTQKSVIELKAMAYDIIATAEQYQQALEAVQQELRKRTEEQGLRLKQDATNKETPN